MISERGESRAKSTAQDEGACGRLLQGHAADCGFHQENMRAILACGERKPAMEAEADTRTQNQTPFGPLLDRTVPYAAAR